MHFGVREHLTTIRRHWGKIALVVFAAVMVTGAVAMLSSKVYVSQARILILNSSPAERASRPNFADSSGIGSPQDRVLTQVAILKSPALAEKLALELGPQRVVDEMTWRWDWLKEIPSQIKDNIILRLYGWGPTAQVLQTIGIRKPIDGGEAGPPVGAARDKIMDAIVAEGIVKTDMFGVAFQSPSGEFSAEALNGLIDIYVTHVVELRRPVDTATIAQQEAERLEQVLAEAEEELEDFSERFDIVSVERQKDLLLDRWSRMQEELSRVRGDKQEIEGKLSVIQAEIETLPRQEAITVTTRPNPVVDRLRERLVQLQTELQRYVVGSAAADRLRREIDSISAQLEQEAQAVSGAQTVGNSTLYQQLTNTVALETAEKEALDVRISFIELELEAVEEELHRVAGHELEYRQLARAVAAKEEAYRYALLKREETAIQTQIAQPSLAQVVPVERGDVPSQASAPRRMRLIAMGLIAGTLAGIGLAYAMEFSRRTIATAEEAEIAVGLPVLAVTERFGFLSKRMKRTRLEIRRFAVWILHQKTTGSGLRLLFSAPHKDTGQTALLAELSKSLQQQGGDVLTLQLVLNDRKAPSVSLVPGDQADVEFRNDVAIVQAPAWEMNRRVREVLAPPKPVQTALLLTNEDTPDTALDPKPEPDHPLASVRPYSVVLIDSPDISQFPEQASLVDQSDFVLPVIEADRSRLHDIRDLLDDLRIVDANIPGIVLTKRRMTRSSWAFSWMALTQRKAWERA